MFSFPRNSINAYMGYLEMVDLNLQIDLSDISNFSQELRYLFTCVFNFTYILVIYHEYKSSTIM